MEKVFYKAVTDRIESLLTANGFAKQTSENNDCFTNENYAVTIEYNETEKLLELKKARLAEGDTSDFSVMSSWILTEESNERDIVSIANDFEDSLSELIGIKTNTLFNRNEVALPTKQAKSESVDISVMAARFLNICPAYKDDYKANVAHYNEFLYDKFFKDNAVPEFTRALRENDKKRVTKMLDWLSECYIKGDDMVMTTVMYSVIATTLTADENLEQAFNSYTEKSDKYKHIYSATIQLIHFLKKGNNIKKYM